MALFVIMLLVGCMAMGAFHYWNAEAEQRREKEALRPFLIWLAKGLIVPLLIWVFFNCGLLVSPFLPQIAQAQAAGKWLGTFIEYTAGVLFILASWWMAITLGWLACRIFVRSDRRSELLGTAGIWMLVAGPLALLIWVGMGNLGTGVAAALCLGAITQAILPLSPPKVGPTYSRAMAKIAFDKFNDAELEIIQQLEQAENDFDGWMLLADLYATHFHDLASAERTVCELCDDPNTTPPQISIALNRLADWHLKLANDPANARWALEQLCERLPETHMARMAQARISQLPASKEDWIRERRMRTVKLGAPVAIPVKAVPEGAKLSSSSAPVKSDGDGQNHPSPLPSPREGERENTSAPSVNEWHAPTVKMGPPVPTADADPMVVALEEANACVKLLEANPNDVAARERFAQVLAEKLGKVDTALEQLDLLLAVPGQAPELRARWLSIEADWNSRLKHDTSGARAALTRIVKEYPQSHEAFEAKRRLFVLEIESSVRQRKRMH